MHYGLTRLVSEGYVLLGRTRDFEWRWQVGCLLVDIYSGYRWGMFGSKVFSSFTHHLRWIDLEPAAMGDV